MQNSKLKSHTSSQPLKNIGRCDQLFETIIQTLSRSYHDNVYRFEEESLNWVRFKILIIVNLILIRVGKDWTCWDANTSQISDTYQHLNKSNTFVHSTQVSFHTSDFRKELLHSHLTFVDGCSSFERCPPWLLLMGFLALRNWVGF